MNYRHIFHAGNFADVFKHAVLTLLVERLKAKDTGFAVIDTHAGAGLYDVTSAAAQRTGEFTRGYGRVAGRLPDELAAYGAAVAALNPTGGIAVYPGSPALVRHLLRPQDRLVACELHPEDAAALKRNLAGDRRVQCHHRDGYEALKALLPPKERRGMVMIDPPFEAADERRVVARALATAHARWPTGIYAIWYPIKARSERDLFHGEIVNTGIRRLLAVGMLVDTGDRADRLNGCGMIVVNPPHGLDQLLHSVLPALRRLLAEQGGVAVEWLVPE